MDLQAANNRRETGGKKWETNTYRPAAVALELLPQGRNLIAVA
jgi:hypothetical protein